MFSADMSYHAVSELSPADDAFLRRKQRRNRTTFSLQQVWPLTHFFLFPFCIKSLICLEGKSITPYWGDTILFSSSQQLPRLRLGPLKSFLS